jgi:hypothetical protein
MLVENTGREMCDSGGAYGRNWERQQGKKLSDFVKEPTVWFDMPKEPTEIGKISFTISLFHYLSSQLAVDRICREFNRINKKAKDLDSEEFMGVSQKAEDWILGLNNVVVGRTFNSYNGDSNLSQIIQGTHLTINKVCYLVLSIHGGCDARGGYTDARLFKLESEYTYDGGFMHPEDVWGRITRANGERINVETSYHGWKLSMAEDGKEVTFDPATDKLTLGYFGD